MSLALHTQKSWPRQVEGISQAARGPKAEVCVEPKYECLFFWFFLWSALFALTILCLDTTSPNTSVSFANGDMEHEASNIPVPLSPPLSSCPLLQCQPASYQRRNTTLLPLFISYFIASEVTCSNLKESLCWCDHEFCIEMTAAPRALSLKALAVVLTPDWQHLGGVRGKHFPLWSSTSSPCLLGTKGTCQQKAFHLGWILKASSLRENYLVF